MKGPTDRITKVTVRLWQSGRGWRQSKTPKHQLAKLYRDYNPNSITVVTHCWAIRKWYTLDPVGVDEKNQCCLDYARQASIFETCDIPRSMANLKHPETMVPKVPKVPKVPYLVRPEFKEFSSEVFHEFHLESTESKCLIAWCQAFGVGRCAWHWQLGWRPDHHPAELSASFLLWKSVFAHCQLGTLCKDRGFLPFGIRRQDLDISWPYGDWNI